MNQSPDNERKAANKSNPWPPRIFLAIACLVPLLIALSRIVYPFDLGVNESVTWAPAQLILAGQNPYDLAHTVRPPYVMSAYGPLYYAFIAVGIQCFGLQFWFGRLLSLLALVVCCGYIYRLIARSTQNSPAKNELCCLGVGIFVSQLPVIYWSGMHRPDLLSLAFALGGLLLANVGSQLPASRRRLLAAAVCFGAAVLCRQTAVLPLLFAVFWNWRTHRREALWLLGVSGSLVAIVCLWLQLASRGGFAELLFIMPSAVSRSLSQANAHLTLLFLAPVTLLVLVLALIGGRPSRSAGESKLDVLWWQGYFVVACLLAYITSGRAGALLNYWLEPCAVGSILACCGVAQFNGLGVRVRRIGFVTVLMTSCWLGYLVFGQEQTRWNDAAYLREVAAATKRYVPPGQPVASVFVDLIVAADRTPWLNDAFQYKFSPRHQRIYQEVIRSGQLAAVLNPGPTPPGYRRVFIGDPKISRSVYLDVREDLYRRQRP